MLNIEKYKKEIIAFAKGKYSNLTLLQLFMADKTGINYKEILNTQVLDWLTEEYKAPILDDAERKYLSAVIKPFRKNVNYISKIDVNYPAFNQFISIKVNHTQCVNLPNFSQKSGMYKGMELKKHYSLEELGL